MKKELKPDLKNNLFFLSYEGDICSRLFVSIILLLN